MVSYVSAGDLNPGPHSCVASILSPEPTPQLPTPFILTSIKSHEYLQWLYQILVFITNTQL